MNNRHSTALVTLFVLLALTALPCPTLNAQETQDVAQEVAQEPVDMRAGEVRAVRPDATIKRGDKDSQAKVSDAVNWADWLTTGEKGRARLGLDNGTVVNLGSAARLQLLPTDATSQTGEFLLTAGKVRAWILEQGPRPEGLVIRTNAAVVGVIGTHVYVQADEDLTTVINISGHSTVNSSADGVTGTERLNIFEATTIAPGKAPAPKRKATWEEVLAAMLSTLPGETFQVYPSQGRPGDCMNATSPEKLPDSLPFAGNGAPFCPVPDTNASRMCLGDDAQPGVQEFSIPGPDGSTLWSAFLVLPKPGQYNDADGAHFLVPEAVPPGSTMTAYLINRGKPVPGTIVQVEMGGRTTTPQTNSRGSVTLRMPDNGIVKLSYVPTSLRTPVPLPEIHATIHIDPKLKGKDVRSPDYLQPGIPVMWRDELGSATLDGESRPLGQVITLEGNFLSVVSIPAQSNGTGGQFAGQAMNGKPQARSITYYDMVGGALSRNDLVAGTAAAGHYLICPRGGEPGKVKIRITALGPVRFTGKGAKGKKFETKLAITPGEVLRIPFHLMAEKTGAGMVPIPFKLTIHVGRD